MTVAAKNVILAGVKSVTLHDPATVALRDLSAQFYLAEADTGINRAAACQNRLQELNPAVAVSASSSELTESFLSQFQVWQAFSVLHIQLAFAPNSLLFFTVVLSFILSLQGPTSLLKQFCQSRWSC